jgi:hypothetical protein
MDEARMYKAVEMARLSMTAGRDITEAVKSAMERYSLPAWATITCMAIVTRAELACSRSRAEQAEMKRQASAECDR